MSFRIVVYYIMGFLEYIVGFSLGFGFLMGILAFAIAPKIGVWFSVFLTMSVTIVLFISLVPELSRSEVDFVFSTPADPRSIFAGRFLAEWLLYSLFFIIYTFFAFDTTPLQRLDDLPLYAASIAASAATLGVFVRVFSFLRFETYMAWLVVPIAAALLTVELMHPSPYWIAITSLIISLVYLPLQEYYTELYTNAYGLLGRLLPRPQSVAPKPMPRSLWQLAWRTTYSGGRKRALAVAASISAFFAAAYLSIVFLNPEVLAFPTLMSAFYLFLLLWDWHSSGLSSERLWISFSADHYAYVRYRMAARSLASLLATSPWIFAYALASLRYPPAAYMAASLASALLAFPILAWLIGAFWGQPQIREYDLVQRPVRYTAKSNSTSSPETIGLYLAPALLAAAGYSAPAVWLSAFIAAFSAAFFCIALFTRLGRGLWDWLIDRLAKVGYV